MVVQCSTTQLVDDFAFEPSCWTKAELLVLPTSLEVIETKDFINQIISDNIIYTYIYDI